MQEGLINGLLSESYEILNQPDLDNIYNAISKGNVLIFIDSKSEASKKAAALLPSDYHWPTTLKSHQNGSPELKQADAFYLENGTRKLFVVSASDETSREIFINLIATTKVVIQKYDLYKGWFGTETLLKSVTCTQGHPLEIIAKGMNEGNTWFVFKVHTDFFAKDEIENWINDVNLPVVTDVGLMPIYGCSDYDALQVQSMFTKESCIKYAYEKKANILDSDTCLYPKRWKA